MKTKKQFSPTYQRVVDVLGSSRNIDIAKDFNVDASTAHGWISRGIPPERRIEFAERHGVNLLWLERGEGPMRPDDTVPVLNEQTLIKIMEWGENRIKTKRVDLSPKQRAKFYTLAYKSSMQSGRPDKEILNGFLDMILEGKK